MAFEYFAFGLNISSEVRCSQLPAGPGLSPDVTVRYGATPPALRRALSQGNSYQVTADSTLLDIKGTGRFLVCGGREIIVEPYPEAAHQALCIFLLGSAFGALLLQRGYWPLHGSAVSIRGGAAIFLGPSGIGKSSLAAAMHNRGYPALTDDVCALTINAKEEAILWPAYPRLKLKTDVIDLLGADPASLQKAHQAFDKFELPLADFSQAPASVTVIYVLSKTKRQDVRLAPLKGFEKVKALTENTYRLHFLHGMGLEQLHFRQAQSLAKQAPMLRVSRPADTMNLDKLADLIEKDFPL